MKNVLKIWLVDNTVTVDNKDDKSGRLESLSLLSTSARNPMQEAAPVPVVAKAAEERRPILRHKCSLGLAEQCPARFMQRGCIALYTHHV
jgi:hypothetical protein